MQTVPGGQSCIIKTKRNYQIEELFEIMRKGGLEEKFGIIELKKKSIIVQGTDKFANKVTYGNKSIVIMPISIKEAGIASIAAGAVEYAIAGGEIKNALANIKGVASLVGLKSRGEKEIQEVMKSLAEEIEKLVEVKTGGCYVATCIYGSYNCPEVWTLRRYRDNRLSTSWFGRQFIQIYYAVSPKVVELFGNKKWFNMFLKPILNRFIRKLQNSGIDSSPYSDKSTN